MDKEIHKVRMEKGNRKIYLPTTTYRDQFLKNFAIIYPLGGTEENPAIITTNKEYMEPNPFPGYYINVIPEILYAGVWGDPNFANFCQNNVFYSWGVKTTQINGQINIVTGSNCILCENTYKITIQGHPFKSVSARIYSAPIRLKVWKIGVMD